MTAFPEDIASKTTVAPASNTLGRANTGLTQQFGATLLGLPPKEFHARLNPEVRNPFR
jgi:hypothetical protein